MSGLRKGPSWPIALCFLAAAFFLYAERGARTQFGQSNYAGTSTGTANAQVITVPNIGSYDDILNQAVVFTAGAGLTNTGLTTINASGLGVRNVLRAIPSGLVGLGGGEVVAAQRVTVMWDGTQFQLLTNANPALPGFIADYGGTSCPTGWFAASSQTLSQTAYAPLFAVLGSTWGSSGGGNFTTPDLRNRTTYGQDISVGGLSSRITVAAGNFNGTLVGAAGAVQSITLSVNQIPVITPAGSVNITDPGHVHSPNPSGATVGTSLVSFNSSVGVIVVPSGSTALIGTQASTTGIGASFAGSVFNSGGGQAHSTLSPGAIVSKCVRA